MADNFLASPIIPGNEIKDHEHKRMVITLVIVLIVAVVIGLVLWFKKDSIKDYYNTNISTSENTEASKRAAELDKATVKLSAPVIDERTVELNKSVVNQSEARKAAIAEELNKAAQK